MSSVPRAVWRRPAAVIAVLVGLLALTPVPALAHGPVDPAGSHWRARITHVPAGLQARVVDGDLRLWMRAAPRVTAEVIDYRGAAYLRFSPGGVYVNTNSAMWFVNQVPTVTPPLDLGPHTPPHWERVSRGHTYIWQDGRLQALSTTELAPGASYAGRWSVAVTVDGRAAKITGGLYHRADPSPVWFWPIIVALLCVAAALRLRRPALDLRIARALAVLSLASFAVASAGHQLHGRPSVSPGQLLVLAIELAFVAWAGRWLWSARHSWPTFLLIAGVAAWQGVALATTLTDGYVLLAIPAVIGRLAEIGCLAGAAGLIAVALVMADRSGIGRGRTSSRDETWQSVA